MLMNNPFVQQVTESIDILQRDAAQKAAEKRAELRMMQRQDRMDERQRQTQQFGILGSIAGDQQYDPDTRKEAVQRQMDLAGSDRFDLQFAPEQSGEQLYSLPTKEQNPRLHQMLGYVPPEMMDPNNPQFTADELAALQEKAARYEQGEERIGQGQQRIDAPPNNSPTGPTAAYKAAEKKYQAGLRYIDSLRNSLAVGDNAESLTPWLARLEELMAKSREGTLTKDERKELNTYPSAQAFLSRKSDDGKRGDTGDSEKPAFSIYGE